MTNNLHANDYDFSSRHSIEITASEDEIDALCKEVVVKYFYHRGEFWLAKIPLDGVERVHGQTFNFSRPKTRMTEKGPETIFDATGLPKRTLSSLNHLQCRFIFRDDAPIELYPLDSEALNEASLAHRITDLIYSTEAVGPPGVTFNFWDGIAGRLICAHRFMSTEEMVFERISVESQYVTESPALPISRDDTRQLLRKSLLRASRAGHREKYFLYRFCGTNNCTTNPFQILDRTIQYSWRQRLGALLYRIPFRPRFYLRIRGLDADPSYRKLVRDDFEEFLNAPETRQRRREYVREKIRLKRSLRSSN